MSDEMEIMREFDKEFLILRKGYDSIYKDFKYWLPDAAKREICRALRNLPLLQCLLNKASQDYKNGYNDAIDIIADFRKRQIAKYSPSPRYCEGMQEALSVKQRSVHIIQGHYYVNGCLALELYRCPFCKTGNCIGESK